MHSNQYTWKSKDGTVTPISKMSDSHLRNTLRMLYRRAEKQVGVDLRMALSMGSVVTVGGMAEFCAADAIQNAMEQTPWDVLDGVAKWDRLLHEAEKRGLDWS